MLTFTDYEIDLRSIPGEICLTFYICDCPCHCQGCSSPWLWERGQFTLTEAIVQKAIVKYPYITCILFMGGDNDTDSILKLAQTARSQGVKAAFYSGRDEMVAALTGYLDYYKIGHWDAAAGPLNAETTNQRLYMYADAWQDITSKFWTRENKLKPQQEQQLMKDARSWLNGNKNTKS